ncbi:MAG TPA: NADH-quinone oxidoreductase subunit J [Ohtaekwangia sp.]|nr:NADH-quinone oxidoreductase subunit J [Ohtaekwangia sp.]
MNVIATLFYSFIFIAAAAALSLIFTRNVFYGALLMIVCLLSIAGIYVLLYAEFLAVTQVLVYAGGILVIILFGIMLTARVSAKPLVIGHHYITGGLLVAGSLFVLLIWFFRQQQFAEPVTVQHPEGFDPTSIIGLNLMREFLLPFEVSGILLLVALIGASVMASFKQKKV